MKDEMRLLVELTDPKNWKPNYTRIGKRMGVPTTTVYDRIHTLDKKGIVKLHIIPKLNLK